MKTTWIKSPAFDVTWILLPAILPCLLVFIFQDYFTAASADTNTLNWIVLVMLIDVSHVYSTLYRTYLNKEGIKKYNALLKTIPLACFIAGVLLYALGELVFWRVMAYLAVFHFIRQQYGFLRIYSRNEKVPKLFSVIQNSTIYSVTLIPILIWHCMGPRNFNWFVDNDFLYFNFPPLAVALKITLLTIVIVYLISELILYKKYNIINYGRLLLVLGTAASWYMGIVLFNGDLIFTMLNVVAHGIPYMALIWVTEKNNAGKDSFKWMRFVFGKYGLVLFVGILFALAYVEEGLWDSLIWREQKNVFGPFYFMNAISHQKALTFIVPLLSLPQVVHYVLDGFIWKFSKTENIV